MSADDLPRRIRAALVEVDARIAGVDVGPETSLVDDLGIDSIRFVDLALALEGALGIKRFPIEQWAATEGERKDKRFTISSLCAVCADCMASGLPERNSRE